MPPFIKKQLNNLAYGSVELRKAPNLLPVRWRLFHVVKHVKKPPVLPILIEEVSK